MIRLLHDNPLLLLFLVAGLGFVIGKIKVAGFSLGVAAVLFVGLAFGALDPSVALPELVQLLGLVLFVYTVGLSSGPGFFASLGGRGLRDNGLALGALALTAATVVTAAKVLRLRGHEAAGLFAGSSTNTPALAATLDAVRARGDAAAGPQAVVIYSLAYPMSVLFVLLAIVVLRRALRSDEGSGPLSRPLTGAIGERLSNVTVRVTDEHAIGGTVARIREREGLHVTFGRLRRGERVSVALDDDVLERGDLLTVVGNASELARAIAVLGERSAERIDLDRRTVDYRRIFVSDPKITRRPLRELGLRRFDAVITRLRRGDVELLPSGDTELELGDRIRVIAPREKLDEVSRFFGDSYQALSEIDVITFSLGIAAGLMLGKVPVPLGGGRHFELGLAGGPLIAGLLLGRVGRVGPFVFTPPFSANITLRQLGLVLFLAGVGTRTGWAFASALRGGSALPILASAAAIAFVVPSLTMLIGRTVLRIPWGVLLGVVSGIQTQPAALAFANEQTKDDLPNAGYATVYPLAVITKIVIAQAILSFV
ncbi:MAG: transporter [Deltaproteobacteria bacterium]|nr:transporter [Deltaproteobacteria bacterium]